jgi:hypothetical protein
MSHTGPGWALNGHDDERPLRQLLGGICCKTRMYLPTGFNAEFLSSPLLRSPDEGITAPTLHAKAKPEKQRPPLAVGGR